MNIFESSTRKLQSLVTELMKEEDKNKGQCSECLFVVIPMNKFTVKEQKFLKESESRFVESVPNNDGFDEYPVYKIEGDTLKTNPTNVMHIASKYKISGSI